MPAEFQFLRPAWLWLLVPLALLLWRLAAAGPGADPWRGLVDPHLRPLLLGAASGGARRLPLVLLALGWLLGVLALAGPAWERLPRPVYQARAYRVILLDLSATMNAADPAPSRLARARFAVLDLLARIRDGQTALLAFATEPYLVAPLTTDTATIAAQVPDLASDLLPVQGARRTDLALARAGELLRQAGAPEGEVLLITDGLEQPAAVREAAGALREAGYRVSVLGVGSGRGAPVPRAEGGFLKGPDGAIVLSRLDAAALEDLARLGGGRYVTATPGQAELARLLSPVPPDARQATRERDAQADQWREEGPWLLLALLPLAALAFRRGWLGPPLLVLVLLPPPPAQALEWRDLWLRPDQQAAGEFAAGQPQRAAERFRRPDWQAAARYQAGDYAAALAALDRQGGEADYNRGNTLARLGRLEEALQAYDQALARDPGDADARANRELVQRLLEQSRPQDGQRQDGQQQDGQRQDGQRQDGQRQDGQRQDGQRQGDQRQDGQRQDGQPSPGTQPPADSRSTPAGAEQAGARDREAPQNQDPEARPPGADAPAAVPEAAPDREDLLAGPPSGPGPAPDRSRGNEDRQALEQLLRQVEDDPAGLLRQRFLLQHLRRSGQLP
jgi:Ca-activated chloride channel family protein